MRDLTTQASALIGSLHLILPFEHIDDLQVLQREHPDLLVKTKADIDLLKAGNAGSRRPNL